VPLSTAPSCGPRLCGTNLTACVVQSMVDSVDATVRCRLAAARSKCAVEQRGVVVHGVTIAAASISSSTVIS
jgi:hypothetical protein